METVLTILIVATALVLFVTYEWLWGGIAPEPYRYRPCTGKEWKDTFPYSKKEELREYLSLFVDAFGFRRSQALRFKPNDVILDIYRAKYPIKGWPDYLELETLARDIEDCYHVDFEKIWDGTLTLGDLFQLVATPNNTLESDAG